MQVLEGEAAEYAPVDEAFLRRRLGGLFERRPDGWAITRVVGHLQLPSGELLRIRSAKASAASVLAWAAYVDPTLGPIQELRALPASADEGDIGALLARLFVDELTRVAHGHGLTRRYQRQAVRSASIRGRIDFARLSHAGGDLSRVPCVAWEQRQQTPLNQTLAAAVDRVQRDPVLRTAAGPHLEWLRGLLEGVRPEPSQALLLGTTQLDRTESPFEAALALARLLLRRACRGEGDRHEGLGFLINLEQLFERTIARALEHAGINRRIQVPVPYVRLDARGGPSVGAMAADYYCPDLPRGPLVIDAKYKTAVSSANPQQMVTYCFVMGARRGALVLPGVEGRKAVAYRFSAGDGGGEVRVEVVGLSTDGRSVSAWREAGQRLAEQIAGL